jgi:hypothetical protein
MILVTAFVFWCMAAATLAPDTAFGAHVREMAIDAAACFLNQGAVALWAKVLVLFVLAGFALVAPEAMLVVGGVADFAILMEVAVLVTLASGVIRLRGVASAVVRGARTWRDAVLAAGRRGIRLRRPARRAGRRMRPPHRNDDEPAGWAPAFA